MKAHFYLFMILSVLIVQVSMGQDEHLVNNLKKHVGILASDSLEGRGFGVGSKSLAIDYIINAFKDAGIEPFVDGYIHSYDYASGGFYVEGKNIVGFIEGSDPVLKNE
ncbi:MAG: hypothetical protein KDC05_04750, partial [Bacteroidales bacterium]|nr:hypothetical protein [Bacteroidales bacterium]